MTRIALFIAAAALVPAAVQLHQQHTTGAGWLPQQQAITQAAAVTHRALCR